jgi:hypothetical protein
MRHWTWKRVEVSVYGGKIWWSGIYSDLPDISGFVGIASTGM